MVCERIEPWARTSEIVGTRSLPRVISSHIDELILIEGRERDAAGT